MIDDTPPVCLELRVRDGQHRILDADFQASTESNRILDWPQKHCKSFGEIWGQKANLSLIAKWLIFGPLAVDVDVLAVNAENLIAK